MIVTHLHKISRIAQFSENEIFKYFEREQMRDSSCPNNKLLLFKPNSHLYSIFNFIQTTVMEFYEILYNKRKPIKRFLTPVLCYIIHHKSSNKTPKSLI